MITLENATQRLGAKVIYRPPDHRSSAQLGEIVGFDQLFVYVRYDGIMTPKATHPDLLDWWPR